jgi:hypothetical protein
MASIAGFGAGISGAVSSLFDAKAHNAKADMYGIEAQADLLKGKGAKIEGEAYDRASQLALLNKDYAAQSTAIQAAQADRQITIAQGTVRANIGAGGLQESGSALDVLAMGASQGALQKEVIQQQGLISEESYQEQSDVYKKMVEASDVAVQGSLLAHEEHLKAAQSEKDAATGSYIGAAIKGVAGVASLFTGGGFGLGSLIPGNWGEQS